MKAAIMNMSYIKKRQKQKHNYQIKEKNDQYKKD